jgi:hypothetical protein
MGASHIEAHRKVEVFADGKKLFSAEREIPSYMWGKKNIPVPENLDKNVKWKVESVGPIEDLVRGIEEIKKAIPKN